RGPRTQVGVFPEGPGNRIALLPSPLSLPRISPSPPSHRPGANVPRDRRLKRRASAGLARLPCVHTRKKAPPGARVLSHNRANTRWLPNTNARPDPVAFRGRVLPTKRPVESKPTPPRTGKYLGIPSGHADRSG